MIPRVVASGLVLLVAAAPLAGQQPTLEVRVVDVGPGLCTVTRIPGDHYLIYDAGHWWGERCVEAVREMVEGEVIDLMVISHSDSDHLGDADEILREYDVQRILWTGHRRPGTANWENLNEALAAEVFQSAATVRALGSAPLIPGETLQLGEATLTFLAGWDDWTAPGPTSSERRNAISIVLRLDWDGRSILYTGDTVGRRKGDPESACKDAEAVMAQRHDDGIASLTADVVLAPHHGGDNGSSTCFIQRVSPNFVIFAAGHSHDHPTAAAARRYLAQGVPLANIFRTDRGDDEGGFEWAEGRIPGCSDARGDDDVEIIIPRGQSIIVRYREVDGGC